MGTWIAWIVIAIVLVAIEVMTQWVWTLCLAIGCLCALIASFTGVGVPVQLAVSAVGAVVAYFLCVPHVRRWYGRMWKDHERADRTGMDALLGRKAIVTEEIKPGDLGRARIDGDNWQVRAPGLDYKVPRGAKMSVTGYDSIILSVEPYIDEK